MNSALMERREKMTSYVKKSTQKYWNTDIDVYFKWKAFYVERINASKALQEEETAFYYQNLFDKRRLYMVERYGETAMKGI
jgi:hypothetical protein